MKSKESALKGIQTLVKRFAGVSHIDESNTESKWIEPLIEHLGWKVQSDDVTKRERLGENFSDYTLKINGQRQFILEAKAAGVSLDGKYQNKTFIEQALDYAKHSDCTWAVLTNFKEFRLYSTDKKEDNGLVFNIHYTDYTKGGFEWLWYFSKESMSNNELNVLGEKLRFKKVKKPIDKVLLNDLLRFREILSKDILKNNESLKHDMDLCDEIVQKLLDRFIFIRNCEDINIENNKLSQLVDSRGIIRKLRESFLDKKGYGYYNSALFAPNECDKASIIISDDALSEVIEGLYESKENNLKYNFSEIESDILGSIYEQYLSHLLNKKKKGGIGENLAKKKQQGIYYTPTYIVDYIVNHTLGVALLEKDKIQIRKLKVMDMACGSGSFLIKCYDVFENSYLGVKESSGGAPQDNQQLQFDISHDRKKSLPPVKKCEIIEKNIFGVDLDKQAVEISQLNLMLKIKHKVKLPFTNINCGDSLLQEADKSYDVSLFEPHGNKGEYDVIVGNPPYVDTKELNNAIVKRLFSTYTTVENRMNLYSVFIERALQLLKDGGYFGFIIPNSILYNESYNKIRRLLLENVCLKQIVRLPDGVFEGVKVETIILIFKKDKKQSKNNSCRVIIYSPDESISHVSEDNCLSKRNVKQSEWIEDGVINLTLDKETKEIITKIENGTKPLEWYCDFTLGLTPYDKYKGHSAEDIENKVFHSDKQKTKYHKPLLNGEDITRYGIHWKGDSFIKYGEWLGAPREPKFFIKPRIIVRQIISGNPARIYAGYSNKELYNAQIAFNVVVKDLFLKEISIKYLLALFNSRLINYYHREKYLDPTKVLFQKILIANARRFPIHKPHKAEQDKIVNLADAMISFNEQLYKFGDEKSERTNRVIKQMDAIESRIDHEIYKIYGLSRSEIDVIESTLKT